MVETMEFVIKVPLWPAGHLPHKGEDSRHSPASREPRRSGWVKPSPLWGGVRTGRDPWLDPGWWGGDFSSSVIFWGDGRQARGGLYP
jgi:hypothetical protein